MGLSDKKIREFKTILEKKIGKEVSWQEASDSAYGLLRFAEICYEGWNTEQHRKKSLKNSQKDSN